jgi:hypothetical protein
LTPGLSIYLLMTAGNIPFFRMLNSLLPLQKFCPQNTVVTV